MYNLFIACEISANKLMRHERQILIIIDNEWFHQQLLYGKLVACYAFYVVYSAWIRAPVPVAVVQRQLFIINTNEWGNLMVAREEAHVCVWWRAWKKGGEQKRGGREKAREGEGG